MDQFYTDIANWAGNNTGLLVAAIAIVFIIGMLLGMGEGRKVIIFRNYDDLFLTFLIPALLFGAFLGLSSREGEQNPFAFWGVLALGAAALVSFYVTFKTLESNGYSPWKFVVAMLVKFPLALIWVLQFITLLKPGGETATQRAKSRGTALIILAAITPIIGALVAEKTGIFSPKQILKGKRIGSLRNHL